MLLASAVAVAHGAAVLFMLVGGLLALRWPRLLYVHVPVALAILGLNLAGAHCPLTDLERWLIADAGGVPYRGGFLEHYLFAPLGLDVHATVVQVGMYTLALGLNALAYGLLARAWLIRRSAPVPGTRPTGRPRRTPGPRAAAPPAGRRTSSRIAAPVRR